MYPFHEVSFPLQVWELGTQVHSPHCSMSSNSPWYISSFKAASHSTQPPLSLRSEELKCQAYPSQMIRRVIKESGPQKQHNSLSKSKK